MAPNWLLGTSPAAEREGAEASSMRHTVRYTALAPDRFKDFWR